MIPDPAHPPMPSLQDLLDLHGKVAVVTGAASGIGSAAAARLAEAGATVYRADLSYPTISTLVVADEGQPADVPLDVTDETAVATLAEHVTAQHARLDIWVNAAGIFPRASILNLPLNEWHRVMGINLDGTLLGSQAAARGMLATTTAGVIVNLASTIVHRVDGNAAHYRASKAGVVALTENLAVELGPSGIRAVAVCPGFTITEGVQKLQPQGLERYIGRIPLKRAATADDVARVVLFAASPMADYLTGTTLVVDGGFLRR